MVNQKTFSDITTITAIVFDFDGVIVVNSEFFKEEAWKHVFAPYVGRYENFLAEAQAQFGFGKKGDRFDILRYVFGRLNVGDIEARVTESAHVFDDFVQEQIRTEGAVPDVHEVLGNLQKRYSLYVNSGTAQRALERSVKYLSLEKYFTDILGGPASKAENIITIIQQEKILPQALLLVGDSRGDFIAAEGTGCHFVGVRNAWNKWGESKHEFLTITHIKELENLLWRFVNQKNDCLPFTS